MLFEFDDPADSTEPRAQTPADTARTPDPLPGRRWPVAIGGLVAGLAIALLGWLLLSSPSQEITRADVDEAIEQALASQADAPSAAGAALDQISPSVVVIRATNPGERQPLVGTGVVINEQGQVLTANHIVAQAASIEMVFSDGSTTAAQVVTNQVDRDIAVLEATSPTAALVPAVMGNSRTLQVGDPVFAVGTPLGLTGSLSAGVISGLNRNLPFPGDQDLVFEDLIQFDAAVNQGSSGGPLLNAQGHVVGIVTALADPSGQGYFVGIGFAVPIDLAAGGVAGGPSQ